MTMIVDLVMLLSTLGLDLLLNLLICRFDHVTFKNFTENAFHYNQNFQNGWLVRYF